MVGLVIYHVKQVVNNRAIFRVLMTVQAVVEILVILLVQVVVLLKLMHVKNR